MGAHERAALQGRPRADGPANRRIGARARPREAREIAVDPPAHRPQSAAAPTSCPRRPSSRAPVAHLRAPPRSCCWPLAAGG
eukprot:5117538-Pyramimonas_sp.AAC.1